MSRFAPGYHKSKEWLPGMLFVLFLNNECATYSKRLKYCNLLACLPAVFHLALSKWKKTLTQVFPREFREVSKNTFFTEHLWKTASV